MLDESAQLNRPVVFQAGAAGFLTGSWVCALGAAMTSGKLTPCQVAHVLAATQTFADGYLLGRGHDGSEWPDFPPAALAPVRDIAIPSR